MRFVWKRSLTDRTKRNKQQTECGIAATQRHGRYKRARLFVFCFVVAVLCWFSAARALSVLLLYASAPDNKLYIQSVRTRFVCYRFDLRLSVASYVLSSFSSLATTTRNVLTLALAHASSCWALLKTSGADARPNQAAMTRAALPTAIMTRPWARP